MVKRNKEIGEICKQARVAYGVSVAKFATAYCGCSKEQVYKYEHGGVDSQSLLLQYFRFFSHEDFERLIELGNIAIIDKKQQ